MKKKMNLKLHNLKVQSFITGLNGGPVTVKGGVETQLCGGQTEICNTALGLCTGVGDLCGGRRSDDTFCGETERLGCTGPRRCG